MNTIKETIRTFFLLIGLFLFFCLPGYVVFLPVYLVHLAIQYNWLFSLLLVPWLLSLSYGAVVLYTRDEDEKVKVELKQE